jgi:hypothetical protein
MNPYMGRTCLVGLCVVAGAALAGPREDLLQATDPTLPEASRLAAFDRLVNAGATDLSLIEGLVKDPKADARQRWVAVRVLGKVGGDAARPSPRELLLALAHLLQVVAALHESVYLGDV